MKEMFEYYCISGNEKDGYSLTLNVGWGDVGDDMKEYTQRTFEAKTWDDVTYLLSRERKKLLKVYGQV